MKRILKSEKLLSQLLDDNSTFHIGVPYESYVNNPNLTKYGLQKNFAERYSMLPLEKGPASRNNASGKMIRKVPEEKTTKSVHISYIRTKDGAHISFMRDYNVYVKILQHHFKTKISFRTNEHGERLVVSPLQTFDRSSNANMENVHTINLFLEIFEEFDVYTDNLEPAINFNEKYEAEILPSGTLDEDAISKLVESSNYYLKNEDQVHAFHQRLNLIKGYDPEIRGRGPNGFKGYIAFGFEKLGLVVLESMYSGNATYIFEMKDFVESIFTDKQRVLKEKKFLKRFYHWENWETTMQNLLSRRAA